MMYAAPDVFRTQKLASYPEHDHLLSDYVLAFSPDGRHVACATTAAGSNAELVMVDGRLIGPYSNILSVGYSSKSTLSYVAFDSDFRAYVTIGSKKFGPYGEGKAKMMSYGTKYSEVASSVTFSPNGTRFAFRVGDREKGSFGYRMVIDGRQGDWFSEMGQPIFSSDDKLAFAAKDYLDWQAIVDGNVIAEYPFILDMAFSPKGELAIVAKEGSQTSPLPYCVFARGTKGAEYDNISRLQFTHDGKLAYLGTSNGTPYIVVDDVQVATAESEYSEFAVASGTNQVAITASKRGWFRSSRHVLVNGVQGPGFDDVTDLQFTPAGKLIYKAASRAGKFWTVEHRAVSEPFDEVWPPVFDHNERKIAFGARRGRSLWWVARDLR